MKSETKVIDGQEYAKPEEVMASALACKCIDAIGDLVDGQTWGVVMGVLAEIMGWASGQLFAGIDAVGPAVDQMHADLNLVPMKQVMPEEEIVPDARTAHKEDAKWRR